MTRTNDIYRSLARTLLAVLALIISAPNLFAQGWNGTSATAVAALQGSGTQEDPYLISSAEDLASISKNKALWAEGLYFSQTADIDLNNNAWTPIGNTANALSTSTVIPTATHKAGAFKGNYDGNGFTIKNAYIDMSDLVDKTNLSFGLFRYVWGGTLRNMVLENISIYPVTKWTKDDIFKSDVKAGILAGAYGVNNDKESEAYIENIIVRNCSIHDNGKEGHILSVFVGGLIGDINSGFGGYANLYEAGKLHIRNISVEADIDFHNVDRNNTDVSTAQYTQFNVGGIIGRLRKPRKDHLPQNTYFKGTINAPLASVAPTWGSARSTSKNNNNNVAFAQAYSGEFVIDTADNVDYLKESDEPAASANRLFSGYVVNGVTVDNTFLANDSKKDTGDPVIGLHTLTANPKTGTFTYSDPESMKMYQGVNHAKYIDVETETDRNCMLNLFNGYVSGALDRNLRNWNFDENGSPVFGSYEILCTSYNNLSIPDLPSDRVVRWTATLLEDESEVVIEENGSAELVVPNPFIYSSIVATFRLGTAEDASEITLRYFPEMPRITLNHNSLTDFNVSKELFDDDYFSLKWYVKRYGSEKAEIAGNVETATVTDPASIEFVEVAVCFNGYEILSKQLSYIYYVAISKTEGQGQAPVTYRASLYYDTNTLVKGYNPATGTDVCVAGYEDYGFLWEVISESSGTLWERTNLHSFLPSEVETVQTRSWIAPWNVDRFYRCTIVLLQKDGANYLTEEDEETHTVSLKYDRLVAGIVGPKNIVYLYDRDQTMSARKYNPDVTAFDGKDNIGADYPDGNDINTGYDPEHAVKTMKRAYELLDAEKGVENNIIVVMGYYGDTSYLRASANTATSEKRFYDKAATITGKTSSKDFNGALWMADGDNYIQLVTSIKFTDIRWVGYSDRDRCLIPGKLHIYCNLNDFTVEDNVTIVGYDNIKAIDYGLLENIKDGDKNVATVAPYLNVVAGIHEHIGDVNIGNRYNGERNKIPGVVSITLNSGCYGRVITGSRNNSVKTNTFGTIYHPHRAVTTVSIFHQDDPHEYTPGKKYTFDIGLLTGGQTDGPIYTETSTVIESGSVGRFIAGSISYGRNWNTVPSETFFGRSELTLAGGSVYELFGGSLGRYSMDTGGSEKCDAYFYGQSIINIEGGSVSGNIYGTGAGGVAGVGTCADEGHHTSDHLIPYVTAPWTETTTEATKYGSFETIRTLAETYNGEHGTSLNVADFVPQFQLLNGEYIPLAFAHAEVNVNGLGTVVKGDIFGGGYGYASAVSYDKALSLAGTLFGDTYVNINGGTIHGSVYGGGAGSRTYYDAYLRDHPTDLEGANKQFGKLARVFGNTNVFIGGNARILGDVFAGSKGIAGLTDMATIFGETRVEINGVPPTAPEEDSEMVIYGNIFGGCDFANIRHHHDDPNCFSTGNTHVIVREGTIGNNIFGGSKGSAGNSLTDDGDSDGEYEMDDSEIADKTDTYIEGSTYVEIFGGGFIGNPYVNIEDKNKSPEERRKLKAKDYRTFNIYGGGYLNNTVHGDSHVTLHKSLLTTMKSIMDAEENPNYIPLSLNNFQSAYMDITFRRFGVYGGGWGELTRVLNSHVTIDIDTEFEGSVKPDWFTLSFPLYHQSLFDVAGGGYSGDVGYWAKREIVDGNEVLTPISNLDSVTPEDYNVYVGGDCNILIDGNAYTRKIIGGGFYGSCKNTNTVVRCGSLRQIYGGSLLGYVHDKAKLTIGNNADDLAKELRDGKYKGNSSVTEDEILLEAQQSCKALNDYIYVTENVYGGNDVKGIIGTTFWEPSYRAPYTLDKDVFQEYADGGPLYFCDVDPSHTDKGIEMNIFGGKIMGNVYGAGNGHYRGYYVPEWVRYHDGPSRMYRWVNTSLKDESGNPLRDPADRSKVKRAKVYRSRPMTGIVKVNIRGNSETDRVQLMNDFYGGGRECTIGQWNTIMPFEDPRRLVKGGELSVNFGGFTTVSGNVYMGNFGGLYAHQSALSKIEVDYEGNPVLDDEGNPIVLENADIVNLDTFDGSTTNELMRLGTAAYDHWWWNSETDRYEPGFPPPGSVDGNFGMTGEHMFRGYMKNIEMEGDVELTFYRDLYDSEGKRKGWKPGEIAIEAYDAQDVKMNSFFLGGYCGSMTNNNNMLYDFTLQEGFNPRVEGEMEAREGHDLENSASVYRVVLPKGVTVEDKIVMGSSDASTKIYAYNDDFTSVKDDEDPLYVFEGGVVTQSVISYDIIAYNDWHSRNMPEGQTWLWRRALPSDYYTNTTNPDPSRAAIYNGGDVENPIDTYTMTDGTVIERYKFNETSDLSLSNDALLLRPMFDLAVTRTNEGGVEKVYAYFGEREYRMPDADDAAHANNKTVVKLTAQNVFSCIGDAAHPEEAYGGIVYGGCFNSGTTTGDVILNLATNLLGTLVKTDAFDENYDKDYYEKWYGSMSGLNHNLGRVFGGGYGRESIVDGDVYINMLSDFRAMNVFGGGMLGPVNGTVNINYIGSENSVIFGAIYGGGLRGDVGRLGITDEATKINLVSGNIDRVYGGSCMGNLYGTANVHLYDEVVTDLSHLDIRHIQDKVDRWSGARLIVGHVFGGNDIAGTIYLPEDNSKITRYSTFVHVDEKQHLSPNNALGESGMNPGKTSPGAANGFNAFPLIGNLYGGSNGAYGEHSSNGRGAVYTRGTIRMATGIGNESQIVYLGGKDASEFEDDENLEKVSYEPFEVPHIESTNILVEGGTIVNLFGGGDNSTITENTNITVNYDPEAMDARAGFETAAEFERVFNVFHFVNEVQINELVSEFNADEPSRVHPHLRGAPADAPVIDSPLDAPAIDGPRVLDWQIYRLFGGNDNADMSIHPDFTLVCGHVGSVYTGGNFGKMTHHDGLSIKLEYPDFHAGAVYGGGRVGDIDPDADLEEIPDRGDDFYGTTVEIIDGVIDSVYGGNDVSGNVKYGTKVMIKGAISGDVYCAGNGNYRYQYAPSMEGNLIHEVYDDVMGRYFMLPQRAVYGGSSPSAAQKLLAINSYRPNVDRAYLEIQGKPGKLAYVHGSVYCGGNSSSLGANDNGNSDILFTIGSNVVLNGVFLGSNGSELIKSDMIEATVTLNSTDSPLDLAMANTLTSADTSQLPMSQQLASDKSLYPYLLDLYMQAVDVYGLPEEFGFKDPDDSESTVSNSYIGEFFVGGNSGSMLTDKRITLTFPEELVVYGKVVGGSNSANLTYKNITHYGGLITPPEDGEDTKLHLLVRNKFEPWKLVYPNEGNLFDITLAADVENIEGRLYFPEGKCNIYGGCYDSGKTIGNIKIDVYSDLVADYADEGEGSIGHALAAEGIGTGDGKVSKKRVVVDGIDKDSRRAFAILGAGYGAHTEVHGDVNVRLLPGSVHPDYKEGVSVKHPSATTIFGGSQNGLLVGNTTVEVRDGFVLTNLYGASEAALMYGSTQTIIGWPVYYVCNETGIYELRRTDQLSRAATNPEQWVNKGGRPAIPTQINLRKGEFISIDLYEEIVKKNPANADKFTKVADTPDNFSENYKDSDHALKPGQQYSNVKWDDIEIKIGDPSSRSGSGEYFGHGNIYGGGHVSSGSTVSLAGQNTVCRYNKDFNRGEGSWNADRFKSYGGNSTILIWDNLENARKDVCNDGSAVKDHISIGTGYFRELTGAEVYPGLNLQGLYVRESGRLNPQISHILTAEDLAAGGAYYGVKFYELVSDGGIYGGGRQVYVEGFRTCDLAFYGYANSTPQYPKLLNTIQRIDMLTVTDCCLQLQGAVDFSGALDSKKYALTRVGEMRMNSSLDPNADLEGGIRSESGVKNIIHNKSRSRNYVSFYYDVHYLGAMTSTFYNPETLLSSTQNSFDFAYHGADGKVPETDAPSFRKFKKDRIDNYYNVRNLDVAITGNETDEELAQKEANAELRLQASKEFDARNVGTAANMVGINNGQILRVQGYCTDDNGQENIYYGPVTGVFEVKLLSLTVNEGGGYVYALNHHDDPNNFLESTGNFVFPGAHYISGTETSYIFDDCFPMGTGWEGYYGIDNPATRAADVNHGHGDCNEEERHYWYVNGTEFTYNLTVTGCTYNGEIQFRLDNSDQLIYLYGFDADHDLKVKSVDWAPSLNNTPDIPYNDISRKSDYRLFLSVDGQPGMNHAVYADDSEEYRATSVNNDNAFVVRIPRADYDGTGAPADGWNPATGASNDYKDTVGSGDDAKQNMPLLGITLWDYVDDYTSEDNSYETVKEYYLDRLKENEKVRIVLEAAPKPGVESMNYTYILNLDINYLLGPTITGCPVIENCALPGEYIFANTFEVKVELDEENMAVTERNWYLAAPEDFTNEAGDAISAEEVIKMWKSHDTHTYVEQINDQKFDGDRQIHIPAYLYRDGWHIIYEIIANNQPFYLQPAAPTLWNGEGFGEEAVTLVVHNYHRMRPYDGSSVILDENGAPVLVNGESQPKYEELNITDGSRIYIEDDDDMEYFYEWLTKLQQAPTRRTPMGEDIDPQYAEGLTVFLMKDVKMPEIDASKVRNLLFKGTFHGNGHTIDMGTNKLFLGINGGEFYNTGFFSRAGKANTSGTGKEVNVFYQSGDAANPGRIENCFLYDADPESRVMLTGDAPGSSQILVNCYRTKGVDDGSKIENNGVVSLTRATLEEFEFGEVAYNLNRFYLNERFARNATGSIDADTERTVGVIRDLYRDGSYRFAEVDASKTDPSRLRTEAVPNYRDYRGKRLNVTQLTYGPVTGEDATHHDCTDPIDESRVIVDENGDIIFDDVTLRESYAPIFPDDFIFFGQDLTTHHEDTSYPETIAANMSNRVYRSSGFYGSKVDQGFHFNADVHAVQPTLTAIDFTGLRVAQHNHTYVKGLKKYADEVCYYPPVLDLPEEGLHSFRTSAFAHDNIFGADVPEKLVSRNLIVYCWGDDKDDIYENYSFADVFGDNFRYTAETAEEDIYCHLVHPAAKDANNLPVYKDGGFDTATDLFHLVDLEDYNAPVAFVVNDKAWYRRLPATFSNGNDAWEGICLPFTPEYVRGACLDETASPIRNHGELTHFFGPDVAADVAAPSHEYWLRKFTGFKEEGGKRKLFFTRPQSTEDTGVGNPAEETRFYHYHNTYFGMFRDYGHAREPYDKDGNGVDYENYPMITNAYPYIISFPGMRFREFDCSGKFYEANNPGSKETPQIITYSCEKETGDDNAVVMGITDNRPPVEFKHDGYTLVGTFAHLTPDDAMIALIDENSNATSFMRNNGSDEVLPFRIYLKTNDSSSEPLFISTRSYDNLNDEQEAEPTDEEMAQLEVNVEHHKLIITSPYEETLNLSLYHVAGYEVRRLEIRQGVNIIDDLDTGIYIIAEKKVVI